MPAQAERPHDRPRVVLVINPTSAKGRAGRAATAVAERLRHAGAGSEAGSDLDTGVEVDEIVGRDWDDALARARAAAQGAAAVAVLGGDGTVHLGVQVVAGTGVPLGIIPAGTGNDLAHLLGLPEEPLEGSEVVAAGLRAHLAGAADGRLRTIDAVRAADKWFAGVLGCGFDSMVNERANRMRWPRGKQRYNLAILAELRVFRPLPFRLTLDGERWETEAMLVAVGNGQSYGGGMRICPGADPADGLLDVTVLGPVPTSRFLRLFPRVYKGTHVERPEVTVRRARTITLESDGVVGYADGERFAPLPITCEVVPGALRVFVPSPPVRA